MGTNTKALTRWVVILTGIGSLMAALDTLVVASALSKIRLDLGASVEQLEWTVNSYNLSFAVLLITGAALGDRFGRRRLYAAGLGLFAVASAVCAVAPNVGVLIAARAVQGAGSALIMPLGLALLSSAFPPEKRGAAIGMFSAITGLAVASGPLIGGAVVQGIDWQWIFWLNVPIALVSIPLVLTKMKESHGPDTGLDLRGLALVTAGALASCGWLVRGNQVGWSSLEMIATSAGPGPCWWRHSQLGSAGSRAHAADAVLPLAGLLGRQRGDLLHVRVADGRGVLLRPVAPGRAGLGPLAPRAARAVDGDVHTIAPIAGALTDNIGERRLMVVGLICQAAGHGLAGADRRAEPPLLAHAGAVHRGRRRDLDGDPGGAELGRRGHR